MAIDQLPDLVLFELFSFLNSKEKIKLKAVCRRLNCLLTGYLAEIPKRLFVHQKEVALNKNWGCLDQPVQHEEFIRLKLFLRCLTVGYFKNVKRLYLFQLDDYFGEQPSFYRNHLLNCLSKLDELFIVRVDAHNPYLFNTDNLGSAESDTTVFHLPNLKSVSFKPYFCFTEKMRINSQRLEKLVFWNPSSEKIILSNPKMIKHIECKHFLEQGFQLNSFPNLEQLNCLSITASFDLSKYPKLKKLGIWIASKRFVDNLLTQKSTLKRSDLEITISGFKVPDSMTYKAKVDLFQIVGNDLFIEFENVENLKNNFSNFFGPPPCYGRLYLTSAFEAHLPGLSRLVRQLSIQYIEVIENPNPDLVIKFLREIKGVNFLVINSCSYGSEFYDQLDSVPFITHLGIVESQFSTVTSYEFICTIKFLRGMCIEKTSLPLEELGDIIERSKVERFVLLTKKMMNRRKGILFKAKKNDKEPFQVNCPGCTKILKTWKEAVCFLRKCEQKYLTEN